MLGLVLVTVFISNLEDAPSGALRKGRLHPQVFRRQKSPRVDLCSRAFVRLENVASRNLKKKVQQKGKCRVLHLERSNSVHQ